MTTKENWLMSDVYYKVELKGSMFGQRIMNTLYYKSEWDYWSTIPHAGAEGLAVNVKQEIWDTAYRAVASYAYMLETIDVTPYNDVFELLYSMPYVLAVNEAGQAGGDPMPPSTCVNVHFNFAAQSALQAAVSPSKGYVALAGVGEAQQAGGQLDATFWNDDLSNWGLVAQKLGENIQELTPPQVWVPVRLKPSGLIGIGVQKFLGAAEIIDARVSSILSNRRSRKRNS